MSKVDELNKLDFNSDEITVKSTWLKDLAKEINSLCYQVGYYQTKFGDCVEDKARLYEQLRAEKRGYGRESDEEEWDVEE